MDTLFKKFSIIQINSKDIFDLKITNFQNKLILSIEMEMMVIFIEK